MNIKNRTIFVGKNCDNLHVMRGIDSASIDLIATDPPFNSKRSFNAPLGSRAVGQKFDDRWVWDGITDVWYTRYAKNHPPVKEVIEAAAVIEGGAVDYERKQISTGRTNSMAAFLCWMAPRLIEMRRILKPTGSLYLHCDDAADSYLRLLLDAVFGRSAFRNAITWCYKGGGNTKHHFKRKHDTIFWYAMPEAGFNRQYRPMSDEAKALFNKKDESGRLYKKHSIRPDGTERRTYLDETPGEQILDWWADIHSFGTATQSKERTGWATQKPVALYERIIKASSNPGDLVFDPFAGCSTTIIAAERLNRQWVGCDIDPMAETILAERMDQWLNEQAMEIGRGRRPVEVRKSPPRREDMPPMPKQEMKEVLYREQEAQCANPYCSSKGLRIVDFHIDHELPKSRGGPDDLWNRMLLCGNCNTRKSDSSWDDLLNEEQKRQPHPPRRGKRG